MIHTDQLITNRIFTPHNHQHKILENMQKKANVDKDKLESAQQSAISTIEQKYLNQIKELQETHQKLSAQINIYNTSFIAEQNE